MRRVSSGHDSDMANADGEKRRFLVITADDYGYWPSYNEGILAAVEAGAVDAVSVMTEREHCDPRPLIGRASCRERVWIPV